MPERDVAVLSRLVEIMTPVVVWERGRLFETLRGVERRRVGFGEDASGVPTWDEVVEDELEIVWYVRTGRRSTIDFGALHRRLRMRDRSSSKA